MRCIMGKARAVKKLLTKEEWLKSGEKTRNNLAMNRHIEKMRHAGDETLGKHITNELGIAKNAFKKGLAENKLLASDAAGSVALGTVSKIKSDNAHEEYEAQEAENQKQSKEQEEADRKSIESTKRVTRSGEYYEKRK